VVAVFIVVGEAKGNGGGCDGGYVKCIALGQRQGGRV